MLCERLRNLREDKDLKQSEVAMYLNIHQTTYSGYELGRAGVPTHILIKLSHFYDTSVDYIVGNTDEMTPYPRKKK